MPLYLEIFELLLAFQSRRRRLRAKYAVGSVGISEAHLLLQLDTEPESTAKDLAEALSLDKSTISREINRAIKNGLLRQRTSSQDRRAKKLSITPKAKKLLGQLDSSQAEILRECFRELHDKDEQSLAELLRLLADGLGAQSLAMRPEDHPVTVENRRLSRVMGMLGNAMGDSSFSISEVHILLTLSKAKENLGAREILDKVPFEPSTLSRKLRRLEAEKWILRRTSRKDARCSSLSLSAKGRRALLAYEESVSKQIGSALEACSSEQIQNYIRILRSISTEASTTSNTIQLQQEVEVRILSTEEERQSARAFLVQQLVRRNLQHTIGCQIFPDKNLSATLLVDKKLRGVCDISLEDNQLRVEHCIFAKLKGTDSIADSFIKSVFSHALRSSEAEVIQVPLESDAYEVASKFQGGELSENALVVSASELHELQR